jgi:hypothetical protein
MLDSDGFDSDLELGIEPIEVKQRFLKFGEGTPVLQKLMERAGPEASAMSSLQLPPVQVYSSGSRELNFELELCMMKGERDKDKKTAPASRKQRRKVRDENRVTRVQTVVSSGSESEIDVES